MRIEQNDAWFRYKFVLVGVLIATLVGYLLQSDLTESGNGSKKRLELLLNSNAACTVLALACLLAINIDIHSRINDLTTKQLGIWIAQYIEPYINTEPGASTKSTKTTPQTPIKEGTFLGWENFLRIEGKVCEVPKQKSLNGSGMHTSRFAAFVLSVHSNLATWGFYLTYIAILQRVKFRPKSEPKKQFIAVSAYCLVHFVLLAFAAIAHTAPGSFELTGVLGKQVQGDKYW